jgi:hypothetical protein
VFLRKNPRGKSVRIVSGQHGDGSLSQNRALIHHSRHKVYRAAMQPASSGQRPFMRIKTGESRQQGRVNIQHPPRPAIHQERCKQTHVPRQANGLDPVLLQSRMDSALVRNPVAPERTVADAKGRHATCSR